ncbi:MAG: hypothetical protein WCV86_05260 [Patescibacteria group bacterium]|jgi:transcription termination factor Rho
MIAYVMQDTSTTRDKRILYSNPGEDPEPTSVLVQDPGRTLREFTRREIFSKSKTIGLQTRPDQVIWWGLKYGKEPIEALRNITPHYSPSGGSGLVIPEQVIKHWGLREGDQVGFAVDSKSQTLLILSVNGIENPETARVRPNIRRVQSEYPRMPLPIEKFGDSDLRAITLLSPIGLGSSHWLIAPGGAGKTWLVVKMVKASIQLLQEIEKLHIIVAFIGDRPEDGAQYLHAIEGASADRVEFYQSPWSDPPANQTGMTKFVTRRYESLIASGKHVVLFFDSITRAVSADTAANNTTDTGGMLKGGILRSSVINVIQGQFGVHGYFPELDASGTQINTALAGTEISSEAVVEQETSGSSTTGITRLLNNPMLKFPKVSVDSSQTYTRQPDGWDFRSEEQRKEMAAVWAILWDKFPRAEEAQRRLVDYVFMNANPKY